MTPPIKTEASGSSTGATSMVLPMSMAIKLKGLSGAEQYNNWKTFKFQFQNFIIATKQDELPEERKVAMLLHMLGVEVVQIYQSFELKNVSLKLVLDTFEEYFAPKKSLSLERNKFLSRRQLPNESLEMFYTSLKTLSSTCELKDLTDPLVKDIFILGLSEDNTYLKERLLEQGDAKSLAEIFELARTITMSRDNNHRSAEVFGIRPQTPQGSGYNSRSSNVTNNKSKCQSCGYQHYNNRCPAFRSTCKSCGNMGHYAKMCREKKVQMNKMLEDFEERRPVEPESELFIGSISIDSHVSENNACNDLSIGSIEDDYLTKSWKILANVKNNLIEMCIDTGAQANVISYSEFKNLGFSHVNIRTTNMRLTSYGGTLIPILGQCIIWCEINNLTLPTRFFVCKIDQPTILGLTSCLKFKLIKIIASVIPKIDSKFDSYSQFIDKNKDLFEGLGCLPGKCKIVLRDNAIPHIDPPRRVPFKLLSKYKDELERMCAMKVIEKVSEPTEWLNSVVLVEKPDGSLRVCLDPQALNKAILRSQYPLPTIEDIRSKLAGAKKFSKLDASTAFWSVVLDEESTNLCAFGTPFGRFKFLRMPYGLNLAPEKFHQKLVESFSDIEGVICYLDDILIFSTSQLEHDKILQKVFERIREINLKLNFKKCIFGQDKITFLGQDFQATGMSPNLSKIEAIKNMPVPKSVKDLQRFLGMVNYLASYVPNLSNKSHNLRKLLKKNSLWCWEKPHLEEFEELIELVCKAPVLGFYDVTKPIHLTSDCSQFAVGACMLQQNKPIAYASKSLTDTQKRWAQIEKELFSIWFGCQKFHQYIYGQSVTVETDHKPLVTLFKKPLADIPSRLQRLMMKLYKYDLTVTYKPGKEMYISDTLSRAPMEGECIEFDQELEQELAIHSNMFYRTVNASDKKLEEISKHTNTDENLLKVKNYILNGWPSHKNLIPMSVRPFLPYKNDLHVVNDIIFKNNCIVVPFSLQNEILSMAHASHMGFQKTKNFVKNIIFWPTLYNDLKYYVQNCMICQKFMPNNQKEPLCAHEVPRYPWEKVGVDLFEFDRQKYIVVVDYYSKFFETALLHSSNSQSIIKQFKSIFSRQGVPAQIITDGGPPFSSHELNKFYFNWNIDHKCSSPFYPKGNGLAEQTVKLIKYTLMKCKEENSDPYLALLHLRNSHSDGQEPPSRLLNARLLRTNIPTHLSQLKTNPVSESRYQFINNKRISEMKKHYDHGSKELDCFQKNDTVFYQKKPGDVWLPATVSKLPEELNSVRTYEITTPDGVIYCRNRIYLRKRNISGSLNNNSKDICEKSPLTPTVNLEDDNYISYESGQSNLNNSCTDIYPEMVELSAPQGETVPLETREPQSQESEIFTEETHEIIELDDTLVSETEAAEVTVETTQETTDNSIISESSSESFTDCDSSLLDPSWTP